MPYNIKPGAFPETQYVFQTPTQDLSWSPLTDNVSVVNAIYPTPSTAGAGGTISGWNFDGVNFFTRIVDFNATGGQPAGQLPYPFAVEWVVPTGTEFNQVSFNTIGGTGLTGGNYTFTMRCRSTSTPPAGASLVVDIRGAAGLYNITNTFDLTGLNNTYQLLSFSFTIPPLTNNNNGVAIILGSGNPASGNGFAGLIFDYMQITQNSGLTDSQQLANRGLSGWPTSSPPTITAALDVWHLEGFWHENWGVETAVNAIADTTLTEADWYSLFGAYVVNSNTWATPAAMADYLLLILDNINLQTFSYSQRDWIRGYVNAGGRILMLGGVYSCGSGFWHESNLASLPFPCTFSSFDLQPGGSNPINPTPQTFQLNTGGIYSSTLSGPPVSLWQHALTPNAGAVVQATVGGNPAIVTGVYGLGKVAVVGLTPYGVVGNNSVWWNDARWATDVMQPLIEWLFTPNPPGNTVLPAISGSTVEGQTLTCSTGTWTGSPTFTYQWVNSSTGNISGATNSTYVSQTSDLGDRLTCTVTATNSFGSTAATSAPSVIITPSGGAAVVVIRTVGGYPVGRNPVA